MEIEPPYFDSKGEEVKEFSVIKIFHYKGVNKQGRGRKNYYMYKWVRLVEFKGSAYWVAYHLSSGSGDYFHLRSFAGKEDRILINTEIVQ